MDAPAAIYALRWLINDTFRQTLASRVFWILLALSGLCIVFCLGVSVEGGAVRDDGELWTPQGEPLQGPEESGRLKLLFGAFPVTFSREARNQVHLLQSVFASWVGGTLGVLMALVWTAGFLPESLHPSSAAVLLARPTPRWLILAGKYVGVVAFIGLHTTVFFVGTWLALGVRTGMWEASYLFGIPIITLHFASIFPASMLLAVLFRSATACVVGGILFWLICYAVNYARHFVVVFDDVNPGLQPLPELTVFASEVGYWLLPKPVDFNIVLEQALGLGESTVTLASQPPFDAVLRAERLDPMGAVLSSAIFPVFALWASARQLANQDY